MIKVALIGIVAALLATWIKSVKAEYSVYVMLAAGMMAALFAVEKLETIVEELWLIQSYFASYAPYIKLLIKIIGITYLAEISSDLCKDAGAGALASQIELFGKLSILALCMPIMTAMLETVDYFLGG